MSSTSTPSRRPPRAWLSSCAGGDSRKSTAADGPLRPVPPVGIGEPAHGAEGKHDELARTLQCTPNHMPTTHPSENVASATASSRFPLLAVMLADQDGSGLGQPHRPQCPTGRAMLSRFTFLTITDNFDRAGPERVTVRRADAGCGGTAGRVVLRAEQAPSRSPSRGLGGWGAIPTPQVRRPVPPLRSTRLMAPCPP